MEESDIHESPGIKDEMKKNTPLQEEKCDGVVLKIKENNGALEGDLSSNSGRPPQLIKIKKLNEVAEKNKVKKELEKAAIRRELGHTEKGNAQIPPRKIMKKEMTPTPTKEEEHVGLIIQERPKSKRGRGRPKKEPPVEKHKLPTPIKEEELVGMIKKETSKVRR